MKRNAWLWSIARHSPDVEHHSGSWFEYKAALKVLDSCSFQILRGASIGIRYYVLKEFASGWCRGRGASVESVQIRR